MPLTEALKTSLPGDWERLVTAVHRVGSEILKAKHALGLETIRGGTQKKADGSPVTPLDQLAHRLVLDAVAQWPKPYSLFPVISEEAEILALPDEVARQGKPFWLIDPLDGTRDLLAGESTYALVVSLMAVRDGALRPVLGIISAPEFKGGVTWGGGRDLGMVKVTVNQREKDKPERVVQPSSDGGSATSPRVLGSRSIPSEKMRELYEMFGASSVTRLGSAIKFALIAEGHFDVYPRLGPTSEWDIAAGDALLSAVGGAVWSLDTGEIISYGKSGWVNPGFLAVRRPSGFQKELEALSAVYKANR